MGYLVSWMVLIPRSLREEFDAAYPSRGAKKILTITAIRHAIDMKPQVLKDLYKEQQRMSDGSIVFNVRSESLKEIAQSMLEARRLGRSAEAIADALIPLGTTETTQALLGQISESAKSISTAAQSIYNAIAQEAMK